MDEIDALGAAPVLPPKRVPLAVDRPFPTDADALEVLACNQGPMAIALSFRLAKRRSRMGIVLGVTTPQERRARIQQKRHAAGQVDRAGKPRALAETDRSAALGRAPVDRLLDRLGRECLAVAHGAALGDVDHPLGGRLSALLQLGGYPFHVAPNAEEIAAPDLRDLLFRVAASDEFHRHVQRFGVIAEAGYPTAAVKVGPDPHVIDARHPDGVLQVIDVILEIRRRVQFVDPPHPFPIPLALLFRRALEMSVPFFEENAEPRGQVADGLLSLGRGGLQEAVEGHELNNPTAGRQRFELVVVQVSWVIVERAAAAVRGNQGRFGLVDQVPKRLDRDMRNVDHHPQPIHFHDDFFAELAQAIVLAPGVTELVAWVAGVTDLVVPVVAQGDVSGPQVIEPLQVRQVGADRIPVLDPDHHHPPAGLGNPLDVVRRGCQRATIRIHGSGEPVDGVELGRGVGERLGVPIRVAPPLTDVDDQEHGVDFALGHLHQVALEFGMIDSRIELLRGVLGARDVDVRIERENSLVDPSCPVEQPLLRRRIAQRALGRRLRRAQGADGEQNQKGQGRPSLHRHHTLPAWSQGGSDQSAPAT